MKTSRVSALLLMSAATAFAACSSSSGSPTTADGGGGSGGSGASGGKGGSGGSGHSTASGGSGGASSSKGGGGHSSHGSSAGASSTAATTGSGGAVGGVPGGKAGVGTTVSGCTIFPSDNPWNVAVDGAAVQVVHTYDSELQQSKALHPDFGGFKSDTGGIPINVVPASQAEQKITFEAYASESDPGPGGWVGANPVTTGAATGTTEYPFFVGMEIEGNPPAGGTAGNLPGDQHGIVLQQAAAGGGACTDFEAWNCVVVHAPPFQCANGAVFDLTSNKLRTAGWTSADAAGLAILPGLVRLDEVMAGEVTHAIRVTFNATQDGYIPPATHGASKNPLGSAYPPMGLRLRMKASVDTSKYTKASQVIMAGLKKYGLIVADNGSDWFFTGESNDGWTKMAPDGQDTIIDELVGDFRGITGADFEAVYSGDPVATGL